MSCSDDEYGSKSEGRGAGSLWKGRLRSEVIHTRVLHWDYGQGPEDEEDTGERGEVNMGRWEISQQVELGFLLHSQVEQPGEGGAPT